MDGSERTSFAEVEKGSSYGDMEEGTDELAC
jgi:hypothetical protein